MSSKENSKDKKVNKSSSFIKVVYFDEFSAQDYLDTVNGGRFNWNEEQNKKRTAEILAEIEAHAEGGINILGFLKSFFSGTAKTDVSGEVAKIVDSTLKSTILTEYIDAAEMDAEVSKFGPVGVYAPENSVTMYKMFSSYLTIVPKEQLPIDMEKLNNAVLGERGYYAMLLDQDNPPKIVLRFNISAFKNNYHLVDLCKMNLKYYGVKVGRCTLSELTIENEFLFHHKHEPLTPEMILNEVDDKQNQLDVYDVVLAGVIR